MLTIEQVAERLHISPDSVRRYLRNGEMGGVKLKKFWLIGEDDLDRFIESHSRPPKSSGEGAKGGEE